MKILLLILLTLIIEFSVYGQEFWTPTGNLSPAGDDWVPAIECDSIGTVIAYSHNVGVFRSTNNGDEWTPTGITNLKVSCIKSSPDGKIFAICNNASGIYIQLSVDDGLNWNQVYSAQHSNNYFSGSGMVFMDNNIVVAAISFTLGPTLGDIGVEIIRSTDGGINWQLLGIVSSWGGAESLTKLNDGRILVATTLSGISYSTNNGSNWFPLTSFPAIFISDIQTNSTGDIFVSHNTAASLSEMIFRSTDNGVSWQETGLLSGQNGGDVEAIYIDNSDKIYVSVTTFGPLTKKIYRSTDSGNNWQELNSGIPSSELVYSLTGNANDIIFAGTQSSGVYKGSEIVAMELSSFTASVVDNSVQLKWTTATEKNNQGFEIERASISYSPDQNWEKIGYVPGNGTTTEPRSYSFTDEVVTAGKYLYRLKQVDFDGTFQFSSATEVEISISDRFILSQNYPNPFNPITVIRYSIPRTSFVNLKVFDLLGNEITTLVNEEKSAGEHKIKFDASQMSSGIYFYQLKAEEYISTKKLIFLK